MRAGIPWAPNAPPVPDPVFAASAAVEDEQRLLQHREAARVVAALRAWPRSQGVEGRPGPANTPYQKGFFLDLGAKLRVAASTAKTLVHTAERLAAGPAVGLGAVRGGAAAVAGDADRARGDRRPGRRGAARVRRAAVAKLESVLMTGLADALRRLAERLQPTTADDRHERAAARRRYTVEAGADGMGWLHLYAPMAELLGMDHQVTKQAVAAVGAAGRAARHPDPEGGSAP